MTFCLVTFKMDMRLSISNGGEGLFLCFVEYIGGNYLIQTLLDFSAIFIYILSLCN